MQLNPQQLAAVHTVEGPLLVLAGAGTGKTRVVTERIGHMLREGVSPKAILAMTFTNKAAGEMRERVAKTVGTAAAGDLTVGTFHAFCARSLRTDGEAIGIDRGFTICDAADQLSTVKTAMRELHIPEKSVNPRMLQGRISLLKNRLADPAEIAADEDEAGVLADVFARYGRQLARSRTLDFDDLLLCMLRLLRESDKTLAKYRRRFRFLTVDEYQDTNRPQYEIVRLLAEKHRNLCVVGDDDQSIYGWRGADVQRILGFQDDFPEAEVVRLETNYRSTSEILDAANRVIAHNPKRHEKALRSALGPGLPVAFVEARDEEDEADYVVRELQYEVRQQNAKLSDVAILFRTAPQTRAFEARLRAHGVPYKLVGGMSFFDRKEVRDVLAYLRLVQNPEDEVALLRVVNRPPRGVGATTLDRVLGFAAAEGISAAAAFRRGAEVPKANPKAVAAVQELLEAAATFTEKAKGKRLPEVVRAIVERVGYAAEIERAYDDAEQRMVRWAAVEEIFSFAENHARRTRHPSLATFLEELTLTANDEREDDDDSREQVTLMTLHAAKGLEFPWVYLVGVEEGLLPHLRSVAEDTIEEERRLMYVGITRARRALTVSYAAERAVRGRRGSRFPSRFWFEMQGEAPPPDWRAAELAVEAGATRSKSGASGRSSRKSAKTGGRSKKRRSSAGTRRRSSPGPGSAPPTR